MTVRRVCENGGIIASFARTERRRNSRNKLAMADHEAIQADTPQRVEVV